MTNTYKFQIGQRVINIKANSQTQAEDKAIEWKNKHAKNCTLSYCYRIK